MIIPFILSCFMFASCKRNENAVEEINIIDLVTSSIFAGQDKIIQKNTVTLEAIATDIQASTYKWSKISGGPAKIENSRELTTKITGLRPGKYVFRITKKEEGMILTDEVAITVQSRS